MLLCRDVVYSVVPARVCVLLTLQVLICDVWAWAKETIVLNWVQIP